MVVDDDDSTRATLLRLLQHMGYSCRMAADGAEAWEMHRAKPADVILADWVMPNMDGVELCRRVREDDAGARYTYFILMTSFMDRQHLLQGMTAGADDFQEKPIDPDALEGHLLAAGRVMALYRRLAKRVKQLGDFDVGDSALVKLHMIDDISRLFAIAKRYKRSCCVALFAIGGFDSLGGSVSGDRAMMLRKVTRSLRAGLLDSDALFPLRDDELLIILTEQGLAEAMRVVRRLREVVAALGLTSSVGLAQLEPFDESAEGWVRRTQRALSQALQAGGNTVTIDA
jgi:CheY-like chemotaxis protein